MDAKAWRDAAALFDELEDPRVVGRCDHPLTDIVMIALVALIGPCEDWDDVAEFGRAYEDWLYPFTRTGVDAWILPIDVAWARMSSHVCIPRHYCPVKTHSFSFNTLNIKSLA